jgi:hypothetical protein
MGPGRIALAAGRADCEVNYSLFWLIVLGGQKIRHPKEMAAQKRFDFRFRPFGARRGAWISKDSTFGHNRITAS